MKPDQRYWHDIVGYNYRLTNIQAAIGCAQLEQLEDFTKKRIERFQLYHDLLDANIFKNSIFAREIRQLIGYIRSVKR